MNATTTYFAPSSLLPATAPALPSGWLKAWPGTPTTSATPQCEPRPKLERNLRRALRRQLPITLGTPAAPWIPTAANLEQARILFAELQWLEGRQLHITTRSPALVGELTTLRDLDRHHAIEVSLLDPKGATWSAVRRLSEAGLLTRVILQWSTYRGGSDPEEALAASFEKAVDCGVEDIVGRLPDSGGFEARGRVAEWRPAAVFRGVLGSAVSSATRDSVAANPSPARLWLESCHRLRLQYGFPRGLPGRG